MARRHKYNARKTVIDGHTFDSRAEARRYQELKLLEKQRLISRIELQPAYVLQETFKNGKEIYEGDIVLCKIHDKEYMGLVEYTNTYGFYYLSGMGRSDTELWGCNEREVIGNIYEQED